MAFSCKCAILCPISHTDVGGQLDAHITIRTLLQPDRLAAPTACYHSFRSMRGCSRHGFFWYRYQSKNLLLQLKRVQVSVISIGNTIQAYLTTKNTQELYMRAGREITALSSRIFGVYTFVSAVIRLYAAYSIENPQLYQLAIWTYAIAWVHFMSEWLIFGTTAWGRALAGPAVISTGSLLWMVRQWGFYVQ